LSPHPRRDAFRETGFENAGCATLSANRALPGVSPQNTIAAIASASGSVLPVERISEEAVRPRFHNAPCTSLETLQQFSLENCRKPLALSNRRLRSRTPHKSTCGTLGEAGKTRNRKFRFACAETVEDGVSLWKDKENREKTWPQIFADDRRSQEKNTCRSVLIRQNPWLGLSL